MSLCDTCPRPGACCRFFSLNQSGGIDQWSGMPLLEAIAGVAASHTEDHPFVPLYRRPNGVTVWWCPNLGRDGRCMDYDRRPYTCRSFEPASEKLCVLWPGHEAVG